MFEVEITNVNTGEHKIIFTRNRFNPFQDNDKYNKDEWNINHISYID